MGYALSPIDLIPDPIPVLGYLDDLILLPIGIWLTVRLIPAEVWAECEARARDEPAPPRSYVAGLVILILWLAAIYFLGRALMPWATGWFGT